MSRAILLLVATSVLACSHPPKVEHEGWIYTDGVAESLVLGRQTGAEVGKAVTGGHVFDEATFCPATHAFQCFSSTVFSFAIPRQFDTSVQTWSHAGLDYELGPIAFTFWMLGTKVEGVFEITAGHSHDSRPAFLYLYSPVRGLLAITRIGDSELDAWPRLWLAGSSGFGAPHFIPAPDPSDPPFIPLGRPVGQDQ